MFSCSYTAYSFGRTRGHDGKIAARSVVCNDLMCFLLNKYGKVSNKVLKDILVESYEATAIHEAKVKLLEDVSALGSCDELPYISKDKQTSGQPTDDIDDTYTLLILVNFRLCLHVTGTAQVKHTTS